MGPAMSGWPPEGRLAAGDLTGRDGFLADPTLPASLAPAGEEPACHHIIDLKIHTPDCAWRRRVGWPETTWEQVTALKTQVAMDFG